MFRQIGASADPAPGLQVVALCEEELNGECDRYIAMMNGDPTLEIGFASPSPEIAADFRVRPRDGMDLLDRTLPELAGEVRGIVRQIGITGSDASKPYQFDGGSHFQLWGALFLNGNFHNDVIAVAEVLAHESAHSLLFGFCTEEPLVENEDDELFASPLRPDPRPMDGIYHATFVSARMHWAMSRLAESQFLTQAERARARQAAESDAANFYAGYGVVAEHGKLSDLGRGLMASARTYMDSIS